MKEQVLNEIVKFDSTAEYYQQLEKSILGNQSCYEATVVDGELLGMKVLVAVSYTHLTLPTILRV